MRKKERGETVDREDKAFHPVNHDPSCKMDERGQFEAGSQLFQ